MHAYAYKQYAESRLVVTTVCITFQSQRVALRLVRSIIQVLMAPTSVVSTLFLLLLSLWSCRSQLPAPKDTDASCKPVTPQWSCPTGYKLSHNNVCYKQDVRKPEVRRFVVVAVRVLLKAIMHFTLPAFVADNLP